MIDRLAYTITIAGYCLFAGNVQGGFIQGYSEGQVTAGSQHLHVFDLGWNEPLSISEDKVNPTLTGSHHVTGTMGMSIRGGSDWAAVEIMNGGRGSVNSSLDRQVEYDPNHYGYNEYTFSAGGIAAFRLADYPDGTPVRFAAFLSIHGEVAPGDLLTVSFGGTLLWYNGAGLHSPVAEAGFQQIISTPGPFNIYYEYDNPEAAFLSVWSWPHDFVIHGGLTVGIYVPHADAHGRTWFTIDPGFGVSNADSGELFPWEAAAVPEPASLTLAGCGALGLALSIWRRKRST